MSLSGSRCHDGRGMGWGGSGRLHFRGVQVEFDRILKLAEEQEHGEAVKCEEQGGWGGQGVAGLAQRTY